MKIIEEKGRVRYGAAAKALDLFIAAASDPIEGNKLDNPYSDFIKANAKYTLRFDDHTYVLFSDFTIAFWSIGEDFGERVIGQVAEPNAHKHLTRVISAFGVYHANPFATGN